MVWGAVIGAAASLAGSALASKGQRDANDANRDMSAEQMAFQERMSNTAHQREVKDLREAGLNPILSTRHGGASSPTGSMATAQNIFGSEFQQGISNAFQAVRMETELDKMDQEIKESASREKVNEEMVPQARANTALLRTQGDLTAQNWFNAAKTADLLDQQIAKTAEEKENAHKTGKILDETIFSAQRAAEADKARADFYKSPIGKWITKLGTGARELNPFLGSTNSAMDLLRGGK